MGRHQSGVALLLTLVVLLLLGIALALIGGTLAHRLKLAKREAETVVLCALSDAALAEGLAELAANPYTLGVPEHEFGEGKIESRVTALGGTSYVVVASGLYHSRRRNVEALVQRTPLETRVTRWRRLNEEAGEARP